MVLLRNSLDPLTRLEYLKIKNKINFINLDLSEHLKLIEAIKNKTKIFFNLAAQYLLLMLMIILFIQTKLIISQ